MRPNPASCHVRHVRSKLQRMYLFLRSGNGGWGNRRLGAETGRCRIRSARVALRAVGMHPTSRSRHRAVPVTERALLFTDVVDSTLVERLGDARAAELWAEHDRRARDLLARHRGREIDRTDGFFLLFDDAARCRALRAGLPRRAGRTRRSRRASACMSAP